MKHLKELRKEHGLSLEEFGNIFGLTRSAVNNYEIGKRLPNILIVGRIADYFHVSTDYLLDRTDVPYPPESREHYRLNNRESAIAQKLYEVPDNNRETILDLVEKCIACLRR